MPPPGSWRHDQCRPRVRRVLERPGSFRESIEVPADGLVAASPAHSWPTGIAWPSSPPSTGPVRCASSTSSPPVLPTGASSWWSRSTADDPRSRRWPPLSFPASRFEREMHDLFGIVPIGHPVPASAGAPPALARGLAPDAPRRRSRARPWWTTPVSYPFVEVQGAGVYEIPVGPVHAGLIEPGHFRFSVVGETISEDDGAAVVRPQGHRAALRGPGRPRRRRARRADLR